MDLGPSVPSRSLSLSLSLSCVLPNQKEGDGTVSCAWALIAGEF